MPGGAGLTTLGLWLQAARPPTTTANSKARPIVKSSRSIRLFEVRFRATASSAAGQGAAMPAARDAPGRIVAAARSTRRATPVLAAQPPPRARLLASAHDAAQGG